MYVVLQMYCNSIRETLDKPSSVLIESVTNFSLESHHFHQVQDVDTRRWCHMTSTAGGYNHDSDSWDGSSALVYFDHVDGLLSAYCVPFYSYLVTLEFSSYRYTLPFPLMKVEECDRRIWTTFRSRHSE